MLGGPRYQALFEAARRRWEVAGDRARFFTLPTLTLDERAALADLLGWPMVPEGSVRVSLVELDEALVHSAVGLPLREVLEALGGPLRNRQEERARGAAEEEARWEEAGRRLATAGRAELQPWLDSLRAGGAVGRAARGAGWDEGDLLAQAVSVALRLPAAGVLLQVLAAEVTGDPHALDVGRPLGALVLRAAASLAGWTEVPASAAGRRALLQEVGVDCDPLSSDVLVLGLRPAGAAMLARHLRESAEAGEPRRITLRELEAGGLVVEQGTRVFVCENPAIVAAAAGALGPRCAPLICLDGVPTTAATRLLGGLRRCGADLRVRADFDWAGLRIAAQVMALTGGKPWRFTSTDYLGALGTGLEGPPLTGFSATSPWDEGLAAVMAREGWGLPEELLVRALLGDLRGSSGG